MLGDHDTIATIAVKDLQAARDFYEGVLGFTPRGDSPEGVLYGAGSGAFLVEACRFLATRGQWSPPVAGGAPECRPPPGSPGPWVSCPPEPP